MRWATMWCMISASCPEEAVSVEDCAGPNMECAAVDQHYKDCSTTRRLDCGPLSKEAQLRCRAAVERLSKCIDRREGEMVAAMERKGIKLSPASNVRLD